MEMILPKAKKIGAKKNYMVKPSPWQELGQWCNNFTKERNLTMDEAMSVLEKVRAEDEGCCRY